MTTPINDGQLKRLQVLYGQLCAHTQQPATREARIGWAQALVMRPIASFKDLTMAEATHLIDTLQGQLGVRAPAYPRRRRLNQADARKAGTEGRRGNQSNEVTLATAEDLARVTRVRDLIGWSQAQLDAWLRSPKSPVRGSNPQIRTLYDANRVYWALKGIARRKGLWREPAKQRAGKPAPEVPRA